MHGEDNIKPIGLRWSDDIWGTHFVSSTSPRSTTPEHKRQSKKERNGECTSEGNLPTNYRAHRRTATSQDLGQHGFWTGDLKAILDVAD